MCFLSQLKKGGKMCFTLKWIMDYELLNAYYMPAIKVMEVKYG